MRSAAQWRVVAGCLILSALPLQGCGDSNESQLSGDSANFDASPEGSDTEALGASRAIAVTVGPESVGKSPQIIGVNIHPYDPAKSNTPLYLRAMGVNATRMFSSYLGPQTVQSFVGASTWGRDLRGRRVIDQQSFRQAVADLSSDPEGKSHSWPMPIKWDAIRQKLTASQILPMIDAQARRGLAYHLQFGGIRGFRVSSQDQRMGTFWIERWEMFRYFYSFARIAVQHGVRRFELINEPNAWGLSPAQVLTFMRVAGSAARRASYDLKKDTLVMGPTLSWPGKTPLVGYMESVYTNLYKQLPLTANYYHAAGGLGNINAMAVHRYGSLPTFYGRMGAYIDGMSKKAIGKTLPLYVTEFQAHAGATWGKIKSNGDTPREAAYLAAQTLGMIGKIDGLFAFTFDTTAGQNGLHWRNQGSVAQLIGSRTKAAAAYGLIARHFAGAKPLYRATVANGGNNSLVAMTQTGSNYVIALANNSGASGSVAINMKALGLDPSAVANIRTVSSTASGEVTARLKVGSSRTVTFKQPSNSLALITVARDKAPTRTLTSSAQAVAQLKAGSLDDHPFGATATVDVITAMDSQQDGTGVLAAKFAPKSTAGLSALRSATLQLSVARSNKVSRILHVYGFPNAAWGQNDVTWNSSKMLLPLAKGTAITSIAGNVVNSRGQSSAVFLGELNIPSNANTVAYRLDVTDFARLNWDGFGILVVREFRREASKAKIALPASVDPAGPSLVTFHGAQAAAAERPQLFLDVL